MRGSKWIPFLMIVAPYNLWAWSVPFQDALSANTEARSVFQSLGWGVNSISYLVFIYLIVSTSRELAKEEYVTGGISFIGAMIAGTAPYVAKTLI